MKKFVFDSSTIHTLHSYSKQLYDAFSRADKQIVESDYQWNSSTEIDFKVNPHKFYCVKIGSQQLFIHRFKNGLYSLECYGFKPKDLMPYDEKDILDLYKGFYGRFHSFDEVLIAFYDLCHELTQIKQNPLF